MNRHHADGSTHRLGELMHRLGSALGPSPEDVVGLDVPRHQLRALFIVAKHGPISVGDLSDATHSSLASTSSLADRLVKGGYVERQPDANDRRRVLLAATPQGHEVAETLMRRVRERFDRLVEAMSPEGRTALEAGLTDMLHAADEIDLSIEPSHHHGDHV